MLDDAPASGSKRSPRLTPRDLRLIREWRPDEPGDRVAAADLTAALTFLSEARNEEIEQTIRRALRRYLVLRSYECRPDWPVLAIQWHTIRSAARALRRALLACQEPTG